MFSENLKLKELEINRIKNLSEFGLKPEECNIKLSKDLKYAIFYTENLIAIVDMNRKILISKLSCEENSKIIKLRITQKNNITYLKQKSKSISLVISSINFTGYFSELEMPLDIIDYVFIEGNCKEDDQDFIFTLTSQGDLEFHYHDETQTKKKKVNVIKDSNFKLKGGHELDVSYMDFIEETNNLIIILCNGTIINYTVSKDPEDLNLTTISYEELLHLDHLEYSKSSNSKLFLAKSSKIFDVSTFKITKFVFELENLLVKDEMEVDLEDSQKFKKNTRQSVFVLIGFTKNKKDSYFSFYELLSNQLIFLNRIQFESKITLDSIVYQSKNKELNSEVPDYFIIIFKSGQKLEIYGSDFLECLKNKSNDKINLNDINELMNVNQIKYRDEKKHNFILINSIEDQNHFIRNVSILGVYIVKSMDYANRVKGNEVISSSMNFGNDENVSICSSNINQYKSFNYSIEIIIRKLISFSTYDVYVTDEDIQQLDLNLNKYINNYALSGDVNQYLEYFDKKNSNDLIFRFRSEVIELISKENLYKNFKSITKIDVKDNSIDFYLLLLLFNNELFSIKYYLSLHENITNAKRFLVSNEILFNTVKNIFYFYLREFIYENLKSPVMDYQFFTSDEILMNLQTIRHLILISKSRNENAYDNPFVTEIEMVNKDSTTIQTVLFEIENIILMMKIIRSYYNNIICKESEENLTRINYLIVESLKTKKENRRKKSNLLKDITYFELIMMYDQSEIYPYWKKLFFNFFTRIRGDKINSQAQSSKIGISDKNMDIIDQDELLNSNDILSYSKFQLFFIYMYQVLDYEMLWKEQESENRSFRIGEHNLIDENKFVKYFSEMKDEFSLNSKICVNFYKLDAGLYFTQGPTTKFDLTVICNFAIEFNRIGANKYNLYAPVPSLKSFNFNSDLIYLLHNDGYKNEALVICKNIISMVTEFSDMRTLLLLLLDMGLVNLAFQYINNCFAFLVCFTEDEENLYKKNLLETIKQTSVYSHMEQLYFDFFEFLISKEHLSLLFALPYNFIERFILKEFLINRKEYEELLIIYYIKIKKINEAESLYLDYKKSSEFSNDSKMLYGNLIDTLKVLYGETQFEILEKSSCNYNSYGKANMSLEINVNKAKHELLEIKKIYLPKMENKNQYSANILLDSIMDIENIPYKHSDSYFDSTIKSLFERKQETAKKTFGLLSDIKQYPRNPFKTDQKIPENNKKIISNMSANLIPKVNLKSFSNMSKSNDKEKPYQNTPIKTSIRHMAYSSSNTFKMNSNEQEKVNNDFMQDSAKKNWI